MSNEPNTQSDENISSQIALWGPTGSGKSWLLHAFRQRVKMINDDIKRSPIFDDAKLELSISAIDDDSDVPTQPPGATAQLIINELSFKKKVTLSKKNGTMSVRERVNTHTHRIKIVDNRGGTIVPVKNQVGNLKLKKEQKDTDAAIYHLKISPFIIAVIPPAKYDDSADDNFSISKKLEDFFDKIDYSSQEYQYSVALCLSRVDEMGDVATISSATDRDIEGFLINQVGKSEQEKILEFIKELNNQGHDARLFATSASGYRYDPDSPLSPRSPNLASDKRSIAELEQWKPEGVDKPFFWLLEKIERQRLQDLRKNEKAFDAYLWKSVMVADRLSAYRSYDDILRHARLGEQKKMRSS